MRSTFMGSLVVLMCGIYLPGCLSMPLDYHLEEDQITVIQSDGNESSMSFSQAGIHFYAFDPAIRVPARIWEPNIHCVPLTPECVLLKFHIPVSILGEEESWKQWTLSILDASSPNTKVEAIRDFDKYYESLSENNRKRLQPGMLSITIPNDQPGIIEKESGPNDCYFSLLLRERSQFVNENCELRAKFTDHSGRECTIILKFKLIREDQETRDRNAFWEKVSWNSAYVVGAATFGVLLFIAIGG